MMYFYYTKKLGQFLPRTSTIHPKDRLNAEDAVGLVELQPADLGLTLNQLSLRYPLKGAQE